MKIRSERQTNHIKKCVFSYTAVVNVSMACLNSHSGIGTYHDGNSHPPLPLSLLMLIPYTRAGSAIAGFKGKTGCCKIIFSLLDTMIKTKFQISIDVAFRPVAQTHMIE